MMILRFGLFLFLLLNAVACEKNTPKGDYSGISLLDTATPAEHGLDIEFLAAAEHRIKERDFGKVNSLIIFLHRSRFPLSTGVERTG